MSVNFFVKNVKKRAHVAKKTSIYSEIRKNMGIFAE